MASGSSPDPDTQLGMVPEVCRQCRPRTPSQPVYGSSTNLELTRVPLCVQSALRFSEGDETAGFLLTITVRRSLDSVVAFCKTV